MNEQQLALLKQMGQENSNLAGALEETPPQIAPSQQPALSDMGMDKFRVHMSENGYNTFLSIMHWAVMVQKMNDGEVVEWTDETFAGMSAGFVGFGNPMHWRESYSTNIAVIVHAHYLNWHGEGSKFRRENPLPHKIIREVAPIFANVNRGWSHAQQIRDLTNDPETYRQL